MKKTLLYFVLVLLINPCCFSQIKGLSWKKNFGGTQYDLMTKVIETSDGGYLMVGGTNSDDGNVSGWHTGYSSNSTAYYDFWVVKLNQAGNIQWQKCLGGSDSDIAADVKEDASGNYIVGGYSSSDDGDISSPKGGNDFWIVKLDVNGNTLWERSFGGSSSDNLQALSILNDGSIIAVGYSSSSDINLNSNYGSKDAWVIKLNSQGWLQWQKSYGGSSADYIYKVHIQSNGNLLLLGSTKSSDYDLTSNAGKNDAWVLQLDSNGLVLNSISYGGSEDEVFYDAHLLSNGGMLVSGYAESYDGDVQGWHSGQVNGNPETDAWIVELNSSFNIQWQKCLGGSGADQLNDIEQLSDGTFLLGGATTSQDGDLLGRLGADYDAWIVNIASTGALNWHHTYGGDSLDAISNIQITQDNAYLMGGYTSSISGDVGFNYGTWDYWLFKSYCYDIDLGPNSLSVCDGDSAQLSVPGGNFVYYLWNDGSGMPSVSLDTSGAYYVEVSDMNACKGRSDTIDVIVNAMPQVGLTLNGPSSICIGETTQIDASSGFVSYAWNNGATGLSLIVNMPGNYWVTITDQNSCTGVSDSIEVELKQVSGGTILSSNGDELCVGQTTILSLLGTFSTYDWSSGENTSSIEASQAGSYFVEITDALGCTGYSDTIQISFLPSDFSLDVEVDEDSLLGPPFEVEFKNTTPVLVNLDFLWDFGDGDTLSSNDYFVYHTYDYNGSYDITLYAENTLSGCRDTMIAYELVYCSGGINNAINTIDHKAPVFIERLKDFIRIYPQGQQLNNIMLYDLKGSLIFYKEVYSNDAFNIPLNGLESAIYVLCLELNNVNYRIKISL